MTSSAQHAAEESQSSCVLCERTSADRQRAYIKTQTQRQEGTDIVAGVTHHPVWLCATCFPRVLSLQKRSRVAVAITFLPGLPLVHYSFLGGHIPDWTLVVSLIGFAVGLPLVSWTAKARAKLVVASSPAVQSATGLDEASLSNRRLAITTDMNSSVLES